MFHPTRKYRQTMLLAAMGIMAVTAVMVSRCKKPFEPEVFKSGTNYLVVDGFIDVSAGGITRFILSRTANVSDSAVNSPELHATIQVESNGGDTYPLVEQGADGTYSSAALHLDKTKQYRVSVKTANGSLYRSDFVIPHPTPAIDSLNWVQNNGVTIYANTHDAFNSTRYYRWTYAETWQYESLVYAEWGVANNLIYHRDSASQQIHVCWKTTSSTDILLGSSSALSQDVISQAPLTKLLQDDGKLDIRYSILVNQYALTAEAYAYWQIIQKNTQQLGSLFDEQPSLLVGNVHALSNPNESVIGFVTAASAQQARIFIDHNQLLGAWKSVPHDYGCQLLFISQNSTNFLIFDYPNKSYVPVYFQSGGGLAIAKDSCVDCTLQGGINHQPAFW